MTADAALALLTVHTQADVEPTLSAAELMVLLDDMAGVDATGKAPADAGWEPTYDRAALASAVVRGWEMKAAKVVPDVNWAADGAQYSTSDVHAHCVAQAAMWRRRIVVGVPMPLRRVRSVTL